MSAIGYKISTFSEYLGIKSRHYGHTPSPPTYDPDDPMAYYIDQTPKALYPGPFDKNGLPQLVKDGVPTTFPVATGLYGLGLIESYRKTNDEDNLEKFRKVADWFAVSQIPNGAWLTHFPVRKFGIDNPWPSAMGQGLGISCLARAYRQFGDDRYLEASVTALSPFRADALEGGVCSNYKNGVIYDEYPSHKRVHVLNGFIFGIWGLLDLSRIAGNVEAGELYNRGLETLRIILPEYDIGYWSLYSIGTRLRNPATIPYHRLHINQMDALYRISGDSLFEKYRTTWSGYLQARFNALRSLPRKLIWLAIHGF